MQINRFCMKMIRWYTPTVPSPAGAAAVTAFNMMSRQNQRKVRSFAMRSGKMLSNKAHEMFGK